jgi:hypothetical protein
MKNLTVMLLFYFATWTIPETGPAFAQMQADAQWFNLILGRPTDNSITINLLPLQDLSLYIEYRPSFTGSWIQSERKNVKTGIPELLQLDNLSPDHGYQYRVIYSDNQFSPIITGAEHFFHTQRSPGSSFTFTIEADPHPYDKKGCHRLWDICLRNQLQDSADFMFDLGDTFGDDHNPFTISSEEMRQLRLECRDHLGQVCHSLPLFFCLGNHEGESGYYLMQTPPANLAVYSTWWRKQYYLNPEPNEFYTGNARPEGYDMGLLQNYYAWRWGDALFVVLDAYRYYTAVAKPRGWEWTLGKTQYDWFHKTLASSTAKFKFVFCHHVLGETRGGVAVAGGYEWGGLEKDGRTWGFSTNRPGWELPIHQLMVKYGVAIFFQGHDHLFAKEELTQVIYQTVPMPSDSTYRIGLRDNGDAFTDVKMAGAGHLRVTVTASKTTVDYVRAWLPESESAERKNREAVYSYSVSPRATLINESTAVPDELGLLQNYPNPFNSSTFFSFTLPAAEHVVLKIHDALGRKVTTLLDDTLPAGRHSILWQPQGLSSQIFFYHLQTRDGAVVKKAMYLK